MDSFSQPNYRPPTAASMNAADEIERESRRRQEAAQEEAIRNAQRKADRRKAKIDAQRAAAGAAARKEYEKTGVPRTAKPQQRRWPPPPPPPPAAAPPVVSDYRGRQRDLSLLGVRVDTPEGIRSAYKRAALRSHPDKNSAPGAAEEFKQIQAAYERLTGALRCSAR